MNVSYIVHVSGKVQGVYFRVSTQQKAIEYSLSGYARNLVDGEVEVFLSGEEANIEKMLAWLQHGPTRAEVNKVKQKQVEWQEHNFFSIS
jgi:acylphosphatase